MTNIWQLWLFLSQYLYYKIYYELKVINQISCLIKNYDINNKLFDKLKYRKYTSWIMS